MFYIIATNPSYAKGVLSFTAVSTVFAATKFYEHLNKKESTETNASVSNRRL